MKKVLVSGSVVVSILLTLLVVSCDWSSGSGTNNFNTANGSMVSNISGVYIGQQSGGRAVSNSSGGAVTMLTIQQSGNRVEVVDNQGSTYTGTVGAPLVLVSGASNQIPNGAQLANYQISFTGRDGVAARDIEFTGTIALVAVSNIEGSDREITDASGTTTTGTTTSSLTIPEQVGVDGIEPGSTTVTETTTVDLDGNSIATVREFTVTGSTTQLRLRGTWVEIGGVVGSVNAVAEGVVGNLSFSVGSPQPQGGGEAPDAPDVVDGGGASPAAPAQPTPVPGPTPVP